MLLRRNLVQGVSQPEQARPFGINRAKIWHRVRTGQLGGDLSAGPCGQSLRPPVARYP